MHMLGLGRLRVEHKGCRSCQGWLAAHWHWQLAPEEGPALSDVVVR